MPKRITMQRFQGVFLLVANQMFARCYYALNYPQNPQWLGIQMYPDIAADSRLAKDLIEIGFEPRWDPPIWIIEREEEET